MIAAAVQKENGLLPAGQRLGQLPAVQGAQRGCVAAAGLLPHVGNGDAGKPGFPIPPGQPE